jgi:uncharacterized Tic20 family protein
VAEILQPNQAAGQDVPPELAPENAAREDRSLALAAHILGILLSFVGPLILLIYCRLKKPPSKYLAFHIKQALWYQAAVLAVTVVLFTPLGVMLAPLVATGGQGTVDPATALLSLGLCCASLMVLGASFIAAAVYPIFGAYRVGSGRHFQYWPVGGWVRRSL